MKHALDRGAVPVLTLGCACNHLGAIERLIPGFPRPPPAQRGCCNGSGVWPGHWDVESPSPCESDVQLRVTHWTDIPGGRHCGVQVRSSRVVSEDTRGRTTAHGGWLGVASHRKGRGWQFFKRLNIDLPYVPAT